MNLSVYADFALWNVY